jgi:hypothetical protein
MVVKHETKSFKVVMDKDFAGKCVKQSETKSAQRLTG